jgi:hypothetical protein
MLVLPDFTGVKPCQHASKIYFLTNFLRFSRSLGAGGQEAESRLTSPRHLFALEPALAAPLGTEPSRWDFLAKVAGDRYKTSADVLVRQAGWARLTSQG